MKVNVTSLSLSAYIWSVCVCACVCLFKCDTYFVYQVDLPLKSLGHVSVLRIIEPTTKCCEQCSNEPAV